MTESRNEVLCIDINQDKVKQMQQGKVPICELDLDVLFERNIKTKKLSFSTPLKEGFAMEVFLKPEHIILV